MAEQDIRKKTDALYKKIAPVLSGLKGGQKTMTEGMLRNWCWYRCHVDELTEQIDSEGVIVMMPSGDKPNPANQPLHQYTQRMGDLYSKIMKALHDVGETKAADELAAFVG